MEKAASQGGFILCPYPFHVSLLPWTSFLNTSHTIFIYMIILTIYSICINLIWFPFYIFIYMIIWFSCFPVVASVESCLESCYLGTRSKVMQRAWVIVRICGTQLGQASVRTDCINCINCMCCNILYILYIHMYCFCILLYSFFSVFIVATDFWGNSCEHLYMPCQGLDRRSSQIWWYAEPWKSWNQDNFSKFLLLQISML